VLERVAPRAVQAWENVAFVAVTHTAREPPVIGRVFQRGHTSRFEHDNDQWHLLILGELTAGARRRSWLRTRVVPQLPTCAYHQMSWLMFAIRPAWSYRLNADFEDHAEHEYAHLVEENPAWETTPCEGHRGVRRSRPSVCRAD
jgi:ubiquinol oxidase